MRTHNCVATILMVIIYLAHMQLILITISFNNDVGDILTLLLTAGYFFYTKCFRMIAAHFKKVENSKRGKYGRDIENY